MKKSLRTQINGSKKTAKMPILYILKFQRFQRLKNKMNERTHAKKPLSGLLAYMREKRVLVAL